MKQKKILSEYLTSKEDNQKRHLYPPPYIKIVILFVTHHSDKVYIFLIRIELYVALAMPVRMSAHRTR